MSSRTECDRCGAMSPHPDEAVPRGWTHAELTMPDVQIGDWVQDFCAACTTKLAKLLKEFMRGGETGARDGTQTL